MGEICKPPGRWIKGRVVVVVVDEEEEEEEVEVRIRITVFFEKDIEVQGTPLGFPDIDRLRRVGRLPIQCRES
jgi:hypothetical protein